jgi:hypothetical protein
MLKGKLDKKSIIHLNLFKNIKKLFTYDFIV